LPAQHGPPPPEDDTGGDYYYGAYYPPWEDDDPDVAAVSYAVREARQESCFMMLGFALFAVLPALVFDWSVTLAWSSTLGGSAHHSPHDAYLLGTTASVASSNSYGGSTGSRGSSTSSAMATSTAMMIHPSSLAVTICAIIMCALGIWKSRFLLHHNHHQQGDATTGGTSTTLFNLHWLVTVETVVVLLVCIAVAYGTGFLLSQFCQWLPPMMIQILQQQQQQLNVTAVDVITSKIHGGK